MPKRVKYPRLKTRIRRGKSGQVWVYYYYDMRADGGKEIALGKDYEEAIRKWREIHDGGGLKIGRLAEAFERWEAQELPLYESAVTRTGYAKNLRRLVPVFKDATWDEIDLPALRQYLDLRTAKTQGNRELSLLSVIWSKALMWGLTKQPWPATGVKNWKNAESAREFEVTPELFAAVYAQGDQVLRDCMDIASATGMRLTDVRAVRMPVDGVLFCRNSKTRKKAEFVIAESPVLTAITERRQQQKSECVMLLATRTGRAVSAEMLRDRWDAARAAAASKASALGDMEAATQIQAMYLRDMRSYASDLAGDAESASKLLLHSDKRLTEKHYRTKAAKLRAVR